METSTARPQEAVERRGKGVRRAGRRMMAFVRGAARPVGQAMMVFLFTFVRWFGIPSPFAAALLLARTEKPTPLMLAGAGVSLAVRALWGLELDVWQYVGIAGLWLALRRCRPRPGIETAALGGLAMMPRVFAALAGQAPLDILLSLAAVPLGMLGAAFFRSAMDGMASTGAPTCTRERACVAALGLLLVGGTGYFWIGSLNLGQLTAVWVTVAYAAANGPVYGVAAGLLCGLSLALGGHDVRMAATLSVMGLLCGLPAVERRRWLFPPAAVAGWAVGYSLTPLSGPTVPFWAALAGAAAYALLPGWMLERVRALARGPEPGVRSMETAFVSQRIEHMRDALERLAKALPDPGSQAITSGEELGELLCARCANRELCWGKGRVRTERLLADMMDRVERGEAVDEDNLPALAEHGCLRAESIEEAAQEALAALKRREAGIRKARYERELTLTHLAALSGTLGELSMMAGGESLNDLKAAHILNLALEELNVPARLSYARRVDGHLQAALETDGMMPVQKPLEMLLRYLATEEDLPLSITRAARGRVELEEIPLYSASVGMSSVCAGERGEGDGVCGDACSAKRCEGGRLLLMLLDGMGHGEEAHRQSEKTLELLTLLLEAGYTRRQAITAVNGIMLSIQEEERFSTVDLADVDLWTGNVYSEKLGACASWVVRGSHMKKVEGASLPLGIVEEAAATSTQYRLHSGDILIMVSDGVADAFETDEQFTQALSDSLYIQPQRMADALLRNALLAGGGTPRDDMSVMVLLLLDRQQAKGS